MCWYIDETIWIIILKVCLGPNIILFKSWLRGTNCAVIICFYFHWVWRVGLVEKSVIMMSWYSWSLIVVLNMVVLTSMEIRLVNRIGIRVTLNLIGLDLGLVWVESALSSITIFVVGWGQKRVMTSIIYSVRVRLCRLLFARAQRVMEQWEGDVRSLLLICSMPVRRVLSGQASPWGLDHDVGCSMLVLGVPLIFNRFFVDALTNGPKSRLLWLGLLVPKSGGHGS